MSALKPCPFCGKQPVVKSGRDLENEWVWVQCWEDGNEEGCGYVHGESAGDYDEAIANWNRRPIEDALRKRTEWQPIGTNPTVVGIRYLVFSEGQGISFAYYWGLGEWQGCGFQPTHWMPLPELP